MNSADESACFSVVLSSDPACLADFADRFNAFALEQGWPGDVTTQFDLACEEIIINTMSYGYPDGRAGRIDVRAWREADRFFVSIEDDSDPFDPFSCMTPDLDASLKDRAIGGLGIHLVRELMDQFGYSRVGGRNRVLLEKAGA